jgi:tetratricopeptide (TPR) repeat protein
MSEVVLDTKTSRNNSRRKKLRSKLLVALPILVLLVAAGGGGWYLINRSIYKADSKTAVTAQDKQYAQAAADLKDKLAKAKTPEEKRAAHQALANLNIEQGDKAGALREAQAAVSSDDTSPDAYVVLAFVRLQSGDRPGAIEAYRKAVELERAKGSDMGEYNAKSYEITIARLERSP